MYKSGRRRGLAAGVFVLYAACWYAAADESSSGLSARDQEGIKATIELYRTSWLKGDAEGVLGTFTEDAVLLPHHGDPPVEGIKAIRDYWFAPGGPPTTITELTITVQKVNGHSSLAFAHGTDVVRWTTMTKGGRTTKYTNSGTYLNVMKKGTDGKWRIHVHMWDDPANQTAASENDAKDDMKR